MRHIFVVALLATLVSANAQAETAPDVAVQIEASEVLSLLYFAQAATGEPSRSDTLLAVWNANASADQKAALRRLEEALRTGPKMSYNVRGVASRHNGTSISALLEGHAGEASSLTDFSRRISGLLPISAQADLIAALRAIEPLHNKHIWLPSKRMLSKQQNALRALARKVDLDAKLSTAARFYGSSWPADVPMRIYLVPRPAGGSTHAHAAGAIAVVETFDGDDAESRLSVVYHELCHSLYAAQPLDLQARLAGAFARHPLQVAASLADGQLNEGLATAISTGWFERALRGDVVDKEGWYADAVVDGYAKAMMPIVSSYITAGRAMDGEFVDYAVLALLMRFPDISTNPRAMFRTAFLGMSGNFDPHRLMQQFRGRFRSTMLYNGLPLSHERTFAHWERGLPSVLVVHPDAVNELGKYPEQLAAALPAYFAEHETFYWITRVSGRLVVVVGAASDEDAIAAFDAVSLARVVPSDPVGVH